MTVVFWSDAGPATAIRFRLQPRQSQNSRPYFPQRHSGNATFPGPATKHRTSQGRARSVLSTCKRRDTSRAILAVSFLPPVIVLVCSTFSSFLDPCGRELRLTTTATHGTVSLTVRLHGPRVRQRDNNDPTTTQFLSASQLYNRVARPLV
eukprot:COSAG02_NODE_11761_length_1660_cov_1.623318_1_plen_150_part_00